MVLIVSVIGFIKYLIERLDIEKREQIGTKWIELLLLYAGTVIVWLISVVTIVLLTGGV